MGIAPSSLYVLRSMNAVSTHRAKKFVEPVYGEFDRLRLGKPVVQASSNIQNFATIHDR